MVLNMIEVQFSDNSYIIVGIDKALQSHVNGYLHYLSVIGKSPFMDYDFSVAYIRHYSTKTIGEWVKNKMKRGTGNRTAERCKEDLTLDFFFAFNKKTEEKLLYAERILKDEL